jgi:tRNA threonylcarbamoyladenosine biosynthesis protein TsaB
MTGENENVLALETSMQACSCAALRAGGQYCERHEVIGRGHAERLMVMASEVMAEAGLAPRELDRIAVTRGPGSFSGLRIAIAAARALALALGVKTVSFSSLHVIAAQYAATQGANDDLPLVVVMDARRGQLYMQFFSPHGEPGNGGPLLLSPALAVKLLAGETEAKGMAAGRFALVGNGGDILAKTARQMGLDISGLETSSDAQIWPRAARMALMAQGAPIDERPPTPLYVRAPDATKQAGFALERR